MSLFDDWNISRRTEPWVRGPEDLEKLRYLIRLPEGHLVDEWRMDSERAIDFARKFDVLTVARRTIVGDAFQWLCDIPWFLFQLHDNPSFVEEFLGIFQSWCLGLTDLALEAGVDVVQRRGWYEIPAYWGKDHFSRFIAPLVEEETQRVHEAGRLHCYLLPEGHGVLVPVLKDLGADVLLGIDPRMLDGGDLGSLFEQLGDSKSFWGGVNAEVTLESEDFARIEEEVRTTIQTLAGNGGLILGAFLFQQITEKSISLMIDAWKKYRNL
jgi:uroporphyrinogen-III decarboxylase